MKKIVALVLSMVMVLGLATTAFAVDSTITGLYVKGTDKAAVEADAAAATVKFFKAAASEVNEDGTWKADGTVEYFTINDWNTYVKANTLADADLVLYTDADAKTVYMYAKQADPVYYGVGAAVADFGKACGQYTDAKTAGYDKDATYYTAFNALYVGAKAGAAYEKQLMVNGELVKVNAAPGTLTKNTHKAVITTDKQGAVESIKCAVCGVVAAKAANYASMPEKAVVAAGPDATGAYWYWTTATEAPAAGTVESAKTFDAGIAMYVGMSVMAAAGSAVVLKKKD